MKTTDFIKAALRDRRVFIALIALILGALIIAFLPWVLINYTNLFPEATINRQFPAYMLYFFTLIFLLAGFLTGDIIEARNRKKTGNYSGRLDDATKARKWLIRTAPYFAALFCLLVGLIADFIIITYL